MSAERANEILAALPDQQLSYTDPNGFCMQVAKVLKEIYREEYGGVAGLHPVALTLARIAL